jgi:hypothetical protein
MMVTPGHAECPPAAVVDSNAVTAQKNATLQGAILTPLRAAAYQTQSPRGHASRWRSALPRIVCIVQAYNLGLRATTKNCVSWQVIVPAAGGACPAAEQVTPLLLNRPSLYRTLTRARQRRTKLSST